MCAINDLSFAVVLIVEQTDRLYFECETKGKVTSFSSRKKINIIRHSNSSIRSIYTIHYYYHSLFCQISLGADQCILFHTFIQYI